MEGNNEAAEESGQNEEVAPFFFFLCSWLDLRDWCQSAIAFSDL